MHTLEKETVGGEKKETSWSAARPAGVSLAAGGTTSSLSRSRAQYAGRLHCARSEASSHADQAAFGGAGCWVLSFCCAPRTAWPDGTSLSTVLDVKMVEIDARRAACPPHMPPARPSHPARPTHRTHTHPPPSEGRMLP